MFVRACVRALCVRVYTNIMCKGVGGHQRHTPRINAHKRKGGEEKNPENHRMLAHVEANLFMHTHVYTQLKHGEQEVGSWV